MTNKPPSKGETMNTVNDRKLVGGMISSIGFSQQDSASIKYIFLYLSNGLKEISFESDDDFCLVLTDSKKVKVQVKINTLTIPFAESCLKTYHILTKTLLLVQVMMIRFETSYNTKTDI